MARFNFKSILSNLGTIVHIMTIVQEVLNSPKGAVTDPTAEKLRAALRDSKSGNISQLDQILLNEAVPPTTRSGRKNRSDIDRH